MDRNTLRYIAAVVLLAAVLTHRLFSAETLAGLTAPDWEAILALIAVGLVSQFAAIDFGSGKQANSSLAFIPFFTAAIVFPPTVSLIVVFVVITISELVFTRRGLVKSAFNVGQLIIALGCSAYLYELILRGTPRSDVQLAGFSVLITAFFAINMLLSSVALALYRKNPFLPTLRDVIGPKGGNLLYDVLFSPVVLLAVWSFYRSGYVGIILVSTPLLLIRHFYLARRKLEEANRDLLTALVKAIETRDPYTSGHSIRVSTLAGVVARDLNLSHAQTERIRTAALLHDIGKIDSAFTAVIQKPYELSVEERQLIQSHSTAGADLLRDLSSVEPEIVRAVRHHHERYDGTGYPDKLKGTDIPLAARIIMLCDSVDAMLSDRPYRNALTLAAVKAELKRCTGSQFDPRIVDVMIQENTLEKSFELIKQWRDNEVSILARFG
jgi:putative nucleotidyltransferase with HDIG domain